MRRSTRTILGLALAAILTASVIPATFNMQAVYAETFMTFDGGDYVEVPSSPELQLPKFIVEVKFRIHDLSSLRGYLVSKSAGTGDGNLDHNYALYVTKYGTIGGGFKATDGKYYYIYSWPPLSLGTWHVAKLVYDGSELRLKIDGDLERTLTVGRNPDSSGTGPLMIGGHSNEKERFLVGDMDYVSITDRRDYDRVYFNDFGSPSPPPPANAPPVAADDTDSTDKNTSTPTYVLSNDGDLDGDTLTITSVTNPPKGSATINGDGTVTYNPDWNIVGTDTYQYTISDGKGGTDTATVTIQVQDIPIITNNPPNAVDDATGTNKDTPVTTNILSNDSDPDGDTLTITSVTNPPKGSATKNSDGTITYTPDAG
ncbi:MAG: Ig-like domain-containing protein, partial [Nitrososphaerales archaeon]